MKKFFLVLFIIIPVALGGIIFLTPDRATSENENRELMTRQSISLKVFKGSFQQDLETYLSDQFPLRDKLIAFQNRLKLFEGKRDINGAYVCKDGRAVQKIISSDIEKSSLISAAKGINGYTKLNIPVYVMYVPSAEISLNKLLPKNAVTYDYDALYTELTAEVGTAKAIDLRSALIDRDDCYYKTDHHWNDNGAYLAYKSFCEARGEKPRAYNEYKRTVVTDSFRGTLYSKTLLNSSAYDEISIIELPTGVKVTADGQPIDFYDMNALNEKDKYKVFQGGNHGIVEITNNSADSDKTILIQKDSFANSFVAYLVGEYKNIVMVDNRYAFVSIPDLAQRYNADEILVLKEIIN